MSTLAYAVLASRRSETDPNETDPKAGVDRYIEAMAALVPAEVLALHATILSVTTTTDTDPGSELTTTTITNDDTLFWAFWGLVGLSVVLYLVPRTGLQGSGTTKRREILRAAIPPLSFVIWTMMQRSTAFDAVCPQLQEAPRTVIALFAAVLLGLAARALAK